MKKILFAASECVPFIKTGGLADVVGALPKAFDKNEYDVRVIIPNYACIPEKYQSEFEYVGHFYMSAGYMLQWVYVGVMKYEYEGIKYYFIDNKTHFGGSQPYGNICWDIENFCFFCKAVLSVLPMIDFKPDIIHCHDWQTGIIPVYIKTEFAGSEFYRDIKTVMTIHNLRFQGVWDIEYIRGLTGLPDYLFTPDKLEFNKGANMLKGGLVYADYITTVSKTYAREIQWAYYGEGLDGLLRARNHQLFGILNGIDYSIYDPETDKKIYKNYGLKDSREGKAANKTALQEQLGLPVDKDKYMVGIISRLTDQKGFDLINCVINEILADDDIQLVVIGTGEERYENMFKHYAWVYKDRVSANILYSDDLAHKLYAAADSLLIPSAFEPCGLTQLISFRYGTLPIVRETGGLKDTVIPLNEYDNTGDGFSFTNYNAHDMLHVIEYSKEIYYNKPDMWQDMVKRGMRKDYSWSASTEKYMKLYDMMLTPPPAPEPEPEPEPEPKAEEASEEKQPKAPAKNVDAVEGAQL